MPPILIFAIICVIVQWVLLIHSWFSYYRHGRPAPVTVSRTGNALGVLGILCATLSALLSLSTPSSESSPAATQPATQPDSLPELDGGPNPS